MILMPCMLAGEHIRETMTSFTKKILNDENLKPKESDIVKSKVK